MIASDDTFSFYLEGTNGKGVLLLHGLTGIPAEMKFVARSLHREGFTIYAPLLAGHGIDHATLTKTGWKDWLASVVAAAEQLKTKIDHVYSAGICVGGKLGMLAAHQRPDLIDATAIYSPCFRFDGWNVPWYYKLAPYGLPVMVKLPWVRTFSFAETESLGIKDDRLRQFMQSAQAEGVIDEFPTLSLLEMYRLGQALRKVLPAMTTPTLILHALEDDLSDPRNAQLITRSIGAPHEMHWIENSYHMIHVDAQHRHVAKLTADFFCPPATHSQVSHG